MTAPSAPFVDPALIAGVRSGDAQTAVDWAISAVQGYTGQILEYVKDDVEICEPRPDGTVQLREMPVLDVSLVEICDLTGSAEYVQCPRFIWSARGRVVIVGAPFSWSACSRDQFSFRVTYSHGYAEAPSMLGSVVLDIAAKYANNPLAFLTRKVGEKSQTLLGQGGIVFDAMQRSILDRYVVQETA